jgi:inorganic pyrophosphatase
MREPLQPLTYVKCRAIGVMHMVRSCSPSEYGSVQVVHQAPSSLVTPIPQLDNGEKDEKLIAVALGDPEYESYKDISELPKHRMAEIRRFFQDYKVLEGKEVQVDKDMGGKDEAQKCLGEAMDYYNTKIANQRSEKG